MRRVKPLSVVALVAVWCLLWGKVTPGVVAMGLIVGLAVTVAFPLPGGTRPGAINPWHTVLFCLRLLRDLVVASVQVTVITLRDGPRARSSVVRVQLRSRSELLIATTAGALSLIPGSLIVALEREQGVLYLHCLGVSDAAGMERARAEALALEERAIRAFGDGAGA